MAAVQESTEYQANPPAEKALRPFQEFIAHRAAGGILLLFCTVAALVWANSPFGDAYRSLFSTPFAVAVSDFSLSKPLLLWINDGLMAIFFFVVGLEIKREILVGELASPRKAALPIAAALGGVLAPAAIYSYINLGGPASEGWGIPMATDIAFALGVMAILGDRVPESLKVFLTALAIVDDIAAVVVIALFYTPGVAWEALAAAAVCLFLLMAANRLGVHNPLVYTILGVALWLATLKSGVHATIAGVLLAMTIPARTRLLPDQFVGRTRTAIEDFEHSARHNRVLLSDHRQKKALEELDDAAKRVQAPLTRMERALHPWITFLIMPVFALANAGVQLTGGGMPEPWHPVALGVVAGLLLGKPLGISLAAWLALRSRVASLPSDLSFRHIHGASWLGGIGFTMSLFIASLAFPEGEHLTAAKIGILAASLAAGIAGSIFLLKRSRSAGVAEPVAEPSNG